MGREENPMKDVFIEKIVTHMKGTFEFFIRFILILTVITVIVCLALILIVTAPQLLPFLIFISAGLIYITYRLFISLDLEYEYSLTNDEFTVESIVAKRKRKQVFSASCKKFAHVGPITDDDYITWLEKSKAIHDYSSSQSRESTWFIALNHSGRDRILLIDYDERFFEAFRRYNPRNVVKRIEKDSVGGQE